MKKIIFLLVGGICTIAIALLFFIMTISNNSINKQSNSSISVQQVYICTGPYAEVYHKSSTCDGLEACSKSVKKTTKHSAILINRRACKICYE